MHGYDSGADVVARDLVYRPGVDEYKVETMPFVPGSDDAKIELLGRRFLDAFIGGPSEVAQQNYTYGPLEEDSMEMSPMEAEAMRRFLKSPEMQERIRRVREKYNLGPVRGV